MKFHVIHSPDNEPEYVLVPVALFEKIKPFLEAGDHDDLVAFDLNDYVNEAAKLRIEAGLTQKQMAQKIGVSQAYISKLERQPSVSAKALLKYKQALD